MGNGSKTKNSTIGTDHRLMAEAANARTRQCAESSAMSCAQIERE